MFRRLLLSVLLSLAAIVAFSCVGDVNGPVIPAADYFPNAVGYQWTYAVYDSIPGGSAVTDTVVVTIVDSTTLTIADTMFSATIWLNVWKSTGHVDSFFVVATDSFALVFRCREDYCLDQRYEYPFEVGDQWYGPHVIDTTVVMARETVSVPAGRYVATFHLKRKAAGLEYLLDADLWFEPRVGLVRRRAFETERLLSVLSIWELLSYHLRPAAPQPSVPL